MITCLLFLLLIGTAAIETQALDFNKLPTKQTSKQWFVEVREADQGENLAKPEKGKFDVYSLEVVNIGKDAESVEIHMFRNEPNSTTMYSLFSCPDSNDDCHETGEMNKGMFTHFKNFLLAEKATELEVVIQWTEKDDKGRILKETFTFT